MPMVALAKSRPWLDDCAINIRETNNCSGANHLYSVAALTDNNGAVVERYRYSAYGERTVLAADGTTVRAASLYGNQIGFTGRYLDSESGLYYFRSRYYSGTLGRFIGRDPWMNKAWDLEKNPPKTDGAFLWGPSPKDGYQDGYALYDAHFVPNNNDPTGENCFKTCLGPSYTEEIEKGLITCYNKCRNLSWKEWLIWRCLCPPAFPPEYCCLLRCSEAVAGILGLRCAIICSGVVSPR